MNTQTVLDINKERLTTLEEQLEDLKHDMATHNSFTRLNEQIKKVQEEITVLENILLYAMRKGTVEQGFENNYNDYFNMERGIRLPSSRLDLLQKIYKRYEEQRNLALELDNDNNNNQQQNNQQQSNSQQTILEEEVPGGFLDDID